MTSGPNLVVTSITSDSAEAIPGGVVTFTFTVKNVGDEDTITRTSQGPIPGTGPSFASLYRQGESDKIDFVRVPLLNPGESFTGSLQVDYSAFFNGPAETFYIVADDDNSVPFETDENDNQSADLVIAAPSNGPLFTPNDDDATLPRPGVYSALAGDDIVRGTSGDDTVRGRAGDDTIRGFGGNDKLIGDNGQDTLIGGGGDDILRGGNHDDKLLGMSGADSIYGGPGADVMRGGDGDDVLKGGGGDDRMYGGPGADILRGGKHDDTLVGGGGADRLYGGPGSDVLRGGKHDDFLNGGGGNDKLFAGSGDDTARGGRGDDLVKAGGGNDKLFGEAGSDVLRGGKHDDFLHGGAGNDKLFGEAGSDVLKGAKGNDLLVGGGGDDVFVFGKNDGTDRIRGFSDGDKLDLGPLTAGMSDAQALDHFVQQGGNAVFQAMGTKVVLLDVNVDDLDTSIFGSADDLLS